VLLDSAPLPSIMGTPVQALRYAPGGIVVRTTSGSGGSTGSIFFVQSALITPDRM